MTIASENPVYVQGNYNAIADDTLGGRTSPAAIIADAVTLLSNNWNDMRSFNSPAEPGRTRRRNHRLSHGRRWRQERHVCPADELGIGTGLRHRRRRAQFPPAARGLGNGQTLNYRGSIVSFFISRQAVGSYKCCDNVYAAPTRGFNFDTDFLLPSLLPPGTPMFRDVNTLTFRQLLRPNQ